LAKLNCSQRQPPERTRYLQKAHSTLYTIKSAAILREEADNGCSFCKLIWDTLPREKRLDIYGISGSGPEETANPSHMHIMEYMLGPDIYPKASVRQAQPLQETNSFRQVAQDVSRRDNVTRGLNQSYPWIDSLCITQDSDEDGRRKFGMMDDIYADAHCNIAATGAMDGAYFME
jgi:hypothetical protein